MARPPRSRGAGWWQDRGRIDAGEARPRVNPRPPGRATEGPCPEPTSPATRPPSAPACSTSSPTTSSSTSRPGTRSSGRRRSCGSRRRSRAPPPSPTSSPTASARSCSTGGTLPVEQVVSTGRIALPELAAENELRVVADGLYMHTGEGLHRFVDPVDGEVYLYSQFEVADARRVFTCFDQPDLKAPLTLTVTAPAHWTVVGVSPTPEPEPAGEGVATWRFAPTPKLSPYVQAVVAGPYHVERGALTSGDGREIPLGVYCRRSLAEYLDADEVMDIARQGFALLRAALRPSVPVREVRPALRARVQRRRDGERRCGDHHRALRVPVEGAAGDGGAARADDPPRAGAHVVRRPRDHALVGRPLAERVVRRVRVHPLPGRGDALADGVDDVQQRGEVLGLPAGPAGDHAPGGRRHPRPRGRRGQLRRHHVRQGRVGAQAARALGRHRGVRRRAAALLPAARLGQHHAARPARGAGDDERAGPGHLGQALAPAGRRHHAAPGRRSSTPKG